MINRRGFLGSLVVASVVPSSLFAGYKGDVRLDNGSFYPLDMRLVKSEWGGVALKVSKGPYSVTGSANDCVDCHGLCATAEVARIMSDELELGVENQKLVLSSYWDFDFSVDGEKERTKWINSLKRFHMPLEDFKEIYKALSKLRGPHNCVWAKK